MSNRVKRDVRLEVAPGALGVTFEADYNGCAGKFFQQTNNRHDQSLSVFQLSPPSLLLTQFYFLLAMHSAVIKRFVMTPAGLESPLAKRVRKGYAQQHVLRSGHILSSTAITTNTVEGCSRAIGLIEASTLRHSPRW